MQNGGKMMKLDNMDGYVISANKFYKMEESDWVILRLTSVIFDSDAPFSKEALKAVLYLFDKYGKDVVVKCSYELAEEL